MKIIYISITFAALLMGSNIALACSVNIRVANVSDTVLYVAVTGPWDRYSDTHHLKKGNHFTYNASGSAFTCHGGYKLWASEKSFTASDYGVRDAEEADQLLSLSNSEVEADEDGSKWANITGPDKFGFYPVLWRKGD